MNRLMTLTLAGVVVVMLCLAGCPNGFTPIDPNSPDGDANVPGDGFDPLWRRL